MAQKMTVTGKPTTDVRLVKELMDKDPNAMKVYAFTMKEGGNSPSSKPLPAGSQIEFTVLVTEKQLKKAGIETTSFSSQKYMIQGEVSIDVPFTICTGDMALIASTIQVLPPKEGKKENVEGEKTKEQETATPSKGKKTSLKLATVKGTVKFVELASITIPEECTFPSSLEVQEAVSYVQTNKTFEKPLLLMEESNVLIDGYAYYLAAKELNIERVPIAYKLKVEPQKPQQGIASPLKKPSYQRTRTEDEPVPPMEMWKSVPLCEIKIPAKFLMTPPNPKSVAEVRAYFSVHGQFDRPVTLDASGKLINGYKRYVVAQELQMATVPCVYAGEANSAEEKT